MGPRCRHIRHDRIAVVCRTGWPARPTGQLTGPQLLWPKLPEQRSLGGMNDSSPPTAGSAYAFAAPTSTLKPALVGSLLCWLALPPVEWGLLAWFAPVPWLLLVAVPTLPGRRPYRTLWFAGVVFWLLAVHWIRLPHPLNYLAWVVLAGYLGIYLPLFAALSRHAVHRWGVPLWLAAPVVWTGLDWLRGHLLTGFLMGSLAHTQVGHLWLIQLANLVGEYGVTFLIVLVAASITQSLSVQKDPAEWRFSRRRVLRHCLALVPGVVGMLAAMAYGQHVVQTAAEQETVLGPRIALIQGNTLADWKHEADRQQQIIQEHLRLSLEAVEQSRRHDGTEVDLVVWPETSFRQTLVTVADGFEPPAELVHESVLLAAPLDLAELVRQVGSAVLVGIDRMQLLPLEDSTVGGELPLRQERFNSSVMVDRQGAIVGTYDKMHRVPFGEFIPFADWIPGLYRLTPLTGGIESGARPVALEAGGVTYSVNICYETAVPHLIRRHVAELTDQGQRPDLLVNLTNDAWYWGSSELEMHLACGIFRAVEMHTPLVIAANGGLSAQIDSCGRVLQLSERQQPQLLLADVPLPSSRGDELTVYAAYGDWFAGACLLCCIVLAASGWRGRER